MSDERAVRLVEVEGVRIPRTPLALAPFAASRVDANYCRTNFCGLIYGSPWKDE